MIQSSIRWARRAVAIVTFPSLPFPGGMLERNERRWNATICGLSRVGAHVKTFLKLIIVNESVTIPMHMLFVVPNEEIVALNFRKYST